jgi:hypothetical protein
MKTRVERPLDRTRKCESLDLLKLPRDRMTIATPNVRQHYIPSPRLQAHERHWMLETASTRDLLKTILRKRFPEFRVPLWGACPHLDFELDLLIDELGARSWPRPRSLGEELRVGLTCLKFVFVIEVLGVRA